MDGSETSLMYPFRHSFISEGAVFTYPVRNGLFTVTDKALAKECVKSGFDYLGKFDGSGDPIPVETEIKSQARSLPSDSAIIPKIKKDLKITKKRGKVKCKTS